MPCLPNEIFVAFISSGWNIYPACPVKRLPNEMRSLFHRGAACLSGVKSLLHLFLWGGAYFIRDFPPSAFPIPNSIALCLYLPPSDISPSNPLSGPSSFFSLSHFSRLTPHLPSRNTRQPNQLIIHSTSSPLSFLLSPLSFLLWPLSFLLWPLSFILSPFSFILSPLAFGLSPLAFILLLFTYFQPNI